MYPTLHHLDVFRKQLAAYSGEFSERGERVDGGGRVLLPASCLAELSTMNVAYPLQFRIRSRAGICYAGVLEFNADNGIIIMPLWMFSALLLQPGDTVNIETCVLPPGKLIKLRPQQSSFIQLSDPKHVLEMHLSQYPVLTRGTSIVLQYLDRDFIIDVTDIQDESNNSVEAISTVRADAQATEVKVEFERPLDMPPSPIENNNNNNNNKEIPQGTNVIGAGDGVEFTPFVFKPPTIVKSKETAGEGEASKEQQKTEEEKEKSGFIPFSGGGRRINDKPVVPAEVKQEKQPVKKLTEEKQPAKKLTEEELRKKRLQAFSGTGRSLK